MIRYTEVNKNNNKDNIDIIVLATNVYQILQKTYIIKQYVEKELQSTTIINAGFYIKNFISNILYAKCKYKN